MVTNKHIIHGVFGDEVPMLEACKKLRASGIRIKDVYSPMPIHGIDGIIGVPRTRIAICAFIYGLTFEATVFCAAHGMALTYFLRCWLVPGAKAKNPDPRTTDDKFLIYLELNDEQKVKAEAILKENHAEEVSHKGSYVVEPKYTLEETH
jgi:hypothetical protein